MKEGRKKRGHSGEEEEIVEICENPHKTISINVI